MRIVFVCGSMEHGKDGVGDYTRRLAAALSKEGHFAAVLALHDLHVQKPEAGTQQTDGLLIDVLRLPAGLTEKQVADTVRPWINAFNPQWFSLQYVPFAFHPKGLALQLSNLLIRIAENRNWHIMVHELWVGMDKNAPKKQVMWGMLQRRLIKTLFIRLQPQVIHTQSLLYQQYLTKLGIRAYSLPLFSNIPVLSRQTTNQDMPHNNEEFSMVIFGTILAGAPVEDFAREAADYGVKNGIRVSLTMLGRTSGDRERWVNAWQSAGMTVSVAGEKSPEEISGILARANIGIATTAIALSDKSGAVAAMREHGIPVLCVSARWEARGIDNPLQPAGILEYRKGNLAKCLNSKMIFSGVSTVSAVARALSEQLAAASTNNK